MATPQNPSESAKEYRTVWDFQPSLDAEDVKTAPARYFLRSVNDLHMVEGKPPIDETLLNDWKKAPGEKRSMTEQLLASHEAALRSVSISPEDGRYRKKTEKLAPYVCEAAYIRARVIVEALWTRFLVQEVLPSGTVPLSQDNIERILTFADEMPVEFTLRVQEIEEERKHDVIGMIESLRELFADILTPETEGFIHLGLTSEDVNDLSQKLIFMNALRNVLLPYVVKLHMSFLEVAEKLDTLEDPNHTGYTLGARYREYASRIQQYFHSVFAPDYMTVKFGGATGTHVAMGIIKQEGTSGRAVASRFVSQIAPDLHYLPVTAQINPHDDFILWCQEVLHFAKDMFEICSDIWEDSGKDVWVDDMTAQRLLFVKPAAGQSGSSAMPQKVQVINVENAKGITNPLRGVMTGLGQELSVNRLQRELSDSRQIREILGDSLPKLLLMVNNVQEDIGKLVPNPKLEGTSKACKKINDRKEEKEDEFERKLLQEDMIDLIGLLDIQAEKYASVPLLAKTHNQPASPTTWGKEIKVFSERLQYLLGVLRGEIKGHTLDSTIHTSTIAAAAQAVIINFKRDMHLYTERGILKLDKESKRLLSLPEREWMRRFINVHDFLSHSQLDEERCSRELDQHYECLGEAIQTVLRRHQVPRAYEIVKKVTRGAQMNREEYQKMLNDLFEQEDVNTRLPQDAKEYLYSLTPTAFIGEASELARYKRQETGIA